MEARRDNVDRVCLLCRKRIPAGEWSRAFGVQRMHLCCWIARLERALETVVRDYECQNGMHRCQPSDRGSCRDQFPTKKSIWCVGCVAHEALHPGKE